MSYTDSQNIQYKASTGQVNLDQAQGIVECFVAGIGNKDSVGDVCATGAFAKSLLRRKPRVVWGHNWNDPIGKVLEMYEVPPNDPRLPAKMRSAGIGGLYAKVQFNLNSEKGKEAFANVAFFGEEQEWSIGYKTLRAQFDQGSQANILYEVELYEVSPVLHGANQLTGTISVKNADGNTPMMMPAMQGMPNMPEEEVQRKLQEELSLQTGSKVNISSVEDGEVTFTMGEKGEEESYKCHFRNDNGVFMFSNPQRINKPMQMPGQMQPMMPMGMPSRPMVPQNPNQTVVVPQVLPGGMPNQMPLVQIDYVGEDSSSKPQGKPKLVQEEADLAEALIKITKRHGKFNEDANGVWAGYKPAAENMVAKIGVKCSNCVMYEGNGVCKIIALKVEDGGKCRFAVIPEGVVKVSPIKKQEVTEEMQEEEVKWLKEIEDKYPEVFIKGDLRHAVKSKRDALTASVKLTRIDEYSVKSASNEIYYLPVTRKDAFETKQAIDPIIDYYRAEAYVDDGGIVFTSGVNKDFAEAVNNAVKALGRNLAGRTARAGRGMAARFNPKAWDGDNDGLVQEGTPYQRPAIPGINDFGTRGVVDAARATAAFNNAPRDPESDRSRDRRKKPEREPGKDRKKPTPDRRGLSSGKRDLSRHSNRDRDLEKQFPNAEENAKREAHDKLIDAWEAGMDMSFTTIGRQQDERGGRFSEDFLRGRELGYNDARSRWYGKGTAEQPKDFDPKAKASGKYSSWYRDVVSQLGRGKANRPEDADREQQYAGIDAGMKEFLMSVAPDTSNWAEEDRASLAKLENDYGFGRGGLSSGKKPGVRDRLDEAILEGKLPKSEWTKTQNGFEMDAPDIDGMYQINNEGNGKYSITRFSDMYRNGGQNALDEDIDKTFNSPSAAKKWAEKDYNKIIENMSGPEDYVGGSSGLSSGRRELGMPFSSWEELSDDERSDIEQAYFADNPGSERPGSRDYDSDAAQNDFEMNPAKYGYSANFRRDAINALKETGLSSDEAGDIVANWEQNDAIHDRYLRNANGDTLDAMISAYDDYMDSFIDPPYRGGLSSGRRDLGKPFSSYEELSNNERSAIEQAYFADNLNSERPGSRDYDPQIAQDDFEINPEKYGYSANFRGDAVRELRKTGISRDDAESITDYWIENDGIHKRYLKKANGDTLAAMNSAYDDYLDSPYARDIRESFDRQFGPPEFPSIRRSLSSGRNEKLPAMPVEISKWGDLTDDEQQDWMNEVGLDDAWEAGKDWDERGLEARTQMTDSMLDELAEIEKQTGFYSFGIEELIKNPDSGTDVDYARARKQIDELKQGRRGLSSGRGIDPRQGDPEEVGRSLERLSQRSDDLGANFRYMRDLGEEEFVQFEYRGKMREVRPDPSSGKSLFQNMKMSKDGALYFVGIDSESGEVRSFRLDRINGLILGADYGGYDSGWDGLGFNDELPRALTGLGSGRRGMSSGRAGFAPPSLEYQYRGRGLFGAPDGFKMPEIGDDGEIKDGPLKGFYYNMSGSKYSPPKGRNYISNNRLTSARTYYQTDDYKNRLVDWDENDDKYELGYTLDRNIESNDDVMDIFDSSEQETMAQYGDEGMLTGNSSRGRYVDPTNDYEIPVSSDDHSPEDGNHRGKAASVTDNGGNKLYGIVIDGHSPEYEEYEGEERYESGISISDGGIVVLATHDADGNKLDKPVVVEGTFGTDGHQVSNALVGEELYGPIINVSKGKVSEEALKEAQELYVKLDPFQNGTADRLGKEASVLANQIGKGIAKNKITEQINNLPKIKLPILKKKPNQGNRDSEVDELLQARSDIYDQIKIMKNALGQESDFIGYGAYDRLFGEETKVIENALGSVRPSFVPNGRYDRYEFPLSNEDTYEVIKDSAERLEKIKKAIITDSPSGAGLSSGRRGMSSGRVIMSDGQSEISFDEEDGDGIYDATRDGYSIVRNEGGGGGSYRRRFPESTATYGGSGLSVDEKLEILAAVRGSSNPLVKKILDKTKPSRLSDKQWAVLNNEFKKSKKKAPSGFTSTARSGGTIAPGGRPTGKDIDITPADITDEATFKQMVDKAMFDGNVIRFNYNGKERQITPVNIEKNQKTGKLNMTGQGLDGVRKLFSFDKIEPPTERSGSLSSGRYGEQYDPSRRDPSYYEQLNGKPHRPRWDGKSGKWVYDTPDDGTGKTRTHEWDTPDTPAEDHDAFWRDWVRVPYKELLAEYPVVAGEKSPILSRRILNIVNRESSPFYEGSYSSGPFDGKFLPRANRYLMATDPLYMPSERPRDEIEAMAIAEAIAKDFSHSDLTIDELAYRFNATPLQVHDILDSVATEFPNTFDGERGRDDIPKPSKEVEKLRRERLELAQEYDTAIQTNKELGARRAQLIAKHPSSRRANDLDILSKLQSNLDSTGTTRENAESDIATLKSKNIDTAKTKLKEMLDIEDDEDLVRDGRRILADVDFADGFDREYDDYDDYVSDREMETKREYVDNFELVEKMIESGLSDDEDGVYDSLEEMDVYDVIDYIDDDDLIRVSANSQAYRIESALKPLTRVETGFSDDPALTDTAKNNRQEALRLRSEAKNAINAVLPDVDVPEKPKSSISSIRGLSSGRSGSDSDGPDMGTVAGSVYSSTATRGMSSGLKFEPIGDAHERIDPNNESSLRKAAIEAKAGLPEVEEEFSGEQLYSYVRRNSENRAPYKDEIRNYQLAKLEHALKVREEIVKAVYEKNPDVQRQINAMDVYDFDENNGGPLRSETVDSLADLDDFIQKIRDEVEMFEDRYDRKSQDLEDARELIPDTYREIQSAKLELEVARMDLDEGDIELDEYTKLVKEINSRVDELNKQLDEYRSNRDDLAEEVSEASFFGDGKMSTQVNDMVANYMNFSDSGNPRSARRAGISSGRREMMQDTIAADETNAVRESLLDADMKETDRMYSSFMSRPSSERASAFASYRRETGKSPNPNDPSFRRWIAGLESDLIMREDSGEMSGRDSGRGLSSGSKRKKG